MACPEGQKLVSTDVDGQCCPMLECEDAEPVKTTMGPEPTDPPVMPTEMPVEEPDCDMVCQADLDRVQRQVDANSEEVEYLTKDLPTVLANTFTTVNSLEQMVTDLKSEVERLTRLFDDHDMRFSCLSGLDMDK